MHKFRALRIHTVRLRLDFMLVIIRIKGFHFKGWSYLNQIELGCCLN